MKIYISALAILVSFLVSNNVNATSFPTETVLPADELGLGPLLDLINGGQATGAAQGSGLTQGGLINGSQLPVKGDGFASVSGPDTRWGTGMMISLIENSSQAMTVQFPGLTVNVGGIALEHGGPHAPHRSHQNGLDADILYMGTKNYNPVIDKDGVVLPTFDHEKNWYYWRLITSQAMKVGAKVESAVSMILVDPRLKTHLCAWAKARESSLDALDLEVLSRLRPTEGHDDHFHVRLRCSPHYANCISKGDGYSRTETGCSEFDVK